jgi:hypothetical protein
MCFAWGFLLLFGLRPEDDLKIHWPNMLFFAVRGYQKAPDQSYLVRGVGYAVPPWFGIRLPELPSLASIKA